MANTRRTFVVEVETTFDVDMDDLAKHLKDMKGVVSAEEYENPHDYLLFDVGRRLWRLEGDDWELAEVRRDIEAAIGERFVRFPKPPARGGFSKSPVCGEKAVLAVPVVDGPDVGLWLEEGGDAGCVASAAEKLKGVARAEQV